jgi:hypothetical protein
VSLKRILGCFVLVNVCLFSSWRPWAWQSLAYLACLSPPGPPDQTISQPAAALFIGVALPDHTCLIVYVLDFLGYSVCIPYAHIQGRG